MVKFISIFYKFLHIASGVDFGFMTFESLKVKCISNFLIITRAVSFSVACMIQTYNDEKWIAVFRHAPHILQYLTYIWIFMRMKRDVTLSGCLTLFQHVDSKLNIKDISYSLGTKNLAVVFICLALRIIWACVLCIAYELCLTGVFKNLFYLFILALRDIVVIVNVFIFYFIKCRLGRFINFLEIDNAHIISFLRLYKIISDITLRLKQTYDSVVS